ncbi:MULTISPECIES: DUF6972 family protein [unclassified Microcoleus]|uniref:DUF6972 family protein n=1 Tax=unclassified Microcoleus TaxID=2642155 RepID=UPI004040A64A
MENLQVRFGATIVMVCFFAESIGYRVDPDGSRLLLYYGEIKVDAENRYHVTPRTRFSEE